MNGDPAAGWVEFTRVFDAPVEDLWAAWTDPEQFALWYGPEGASIPLARFEDRLGGSRFVCMEMNPPQGTVRMFLAGEYLEYEPLRRLVYTEVPADSEGARLDSPDHDGAAPTGETRVVVEFADRGGSTTVHLRHEGVPAGSPGEAGWLMALGALGERLSDRSG
ncbi:MAG: SRPBCC domain-containing protein [Microthrixaceae bacterium]|nr:SRPBCC domain-containing protein [Microthrixaceae bacterium]